MNGSPESARLSDREPSEDDELVIDDSRAAKGRAETSFVEDYPAIPSSVGAARAAVARFLVERGVSARVREAVALALSEAATNVVVHAYRDQTDATGAIEVTAAVAADELWVIVTDRGSGLSPRPDSPGLGLGLAIIAQVADGVDLLKPGDGGLELRMRFALEAPRR